ncbi:MAG: heme-binding protein, partial [Chloroflexi bacterium]|nr:heme-binding protein [Chloroflexota bacterium]
SQPGGPLYNIEHSNQGLITFPGGLPLKNNAGEVIGAIGVSGSTVEDDHAVASAGAGVVS